MDLRSKCGLLELHPSASAAGKQRAAARTGAAGASARTGRPEAEISPHPASHLSSGQLGWAGGDPGGPSWSQGHLVRWRASPTGASASSFASSPYSGWRLQEPPSTKRAPRPNQWLNPIPMHPTDWAASKSAPCQPGLNSRTMASKSVQVTWPGR
jgi:hypothetical protein